MLFNPRLSVDSRPHWFRCRAAAARWEEECLLKREGMYRTLQFFSQSAQTWQCRAARDKEQGKLGAGVYALRYGNDTCVEGFSD